MKSTDKETFLLQFEASFLASWCATNYADICARGMQEQLEQPPVEDAEYLAHAAWNQRLKILDVSKSE